MPNVVQTPTNSVSPTVKLIQPFIVISERDYSEYQGLYVQDVVATFTIPANSTVNITVKYLKGLTGINWDDGAGLQSEVDANGTRQYSHQYVNDTNEAKEYNAIFKGVTEIYGFTSTDAAFAGITELTKIRLPYTIKYIGGWSFYNTGLTELTVPYGLTEILNNTFEHSDNLKFLVISETISMLGNSSFTNTVLENVVLPDNVQTIGSYCFLATQDEYRVLKNIKIGAGISTIGRGAFSGQTSLKTMIICAVNPPLVNQVDLEPVIPTSIERIVVPIESVNLYKQAAYWSQFANKIVGYVDTNMLNAVIAGVNSDIEDINSKIPSAASSTNKLVDTAQMEAFALPITTKYGANLSLAFNSTNGQLTAQLKDQDGNNLGQAHTVEIDLQSLENTINNILALIPSQATAQNQLADKNFVNSSISTNTSHFIGTFNSLAELEAYTGTVTNNDYANVIRTESGQTYYDRYTYNGDTEAWEFNFTVNSTSFTAVQWAAINSGITAGKVAEIDQKVNKTTTIAGIALSGNISAQSLTDALIYMNTTTDLDYVMGEE